MIITEEKEVPDVVYEKGDEKVEIYREINPENPRTLHEPLTRMKCAHKKYNLGDEQINTAEYGGWSEIREAIRDEENAVVIASLYLYDHSGLRIKIGSFVGQLPQGHARFDSGQVGFVYISEDDLEDTELDEDNTDKLRRIMKREVDTYDDYLRGAVYRYIRYEDGERVDSCAGFYEYNHQLLLEEAGVEDEESWERSEPHR